MTQRRVFTIGHSAHTIDAFAGLLVAHDVRCVADVRRVPGSRRHPHFGRAALASALGARGIDYAHLEALGGRRSVAPDSPNAALDDAVRGYADHMASPDFTAGVERLERLAAIAPTAVMCAEASWRDCHRRLLADVLVVRGWTVAHVEADGRLTIHALTPGATERDGRVTYPGEQLSLG